MTLGAGVSVEPGQPTFPQSNKAMISSTFDLILFSFSVGFAGFAAWRVATALADGRVDAIAITVAGVALELGAITQVLSVFHALRPWPWIVAQFVIAAGVWYWLPAARDWRGPAAVPREPPLASDEWAGAIALVILVGSGLVWVALTPIQNSDVLNYHASRVLYWIQHGDVFRFETHNDRQVVFPWQSELFFLWPILFTHNETIGRIIYWLGVPWALLAMGVLLHQLKASRRAILAGLLLFSGAPLVRDISLNLKPEWWQTACTLFFAANVLRAEAQRARAGRHLAVATVFLVLAINTKFLALGLVPILGVAAWWFGRSKLVASCLVAGVIASALCGLLLVGATNLRRDGHPLGPRAFRATHSDAGEPGYYCTKAIRVVMLLAEPADLTFPTWRGRLEQAGNALAAKLGAKSLPAESPEVPWPGVWRYTVSNPAVHFSVAGLVTLLMLFFSAAALVSRWTPVGSDSWRAYDLRWLALTTMGSFFSTVLGVRWMVNSMVPDRFLVPACALAVGWAVTAYERCWRRSALAGGLAILVLAWALWFPLQHAAFADVQQVVHPVKATEASALIADIEARLPKDARVLIVVGQAFGDYAVFGPASGYRRAVFPWGRGRFDQTRFEQRLREDRITHVLLENDTSIDFQWDPSLDSTGFVRSLEAKPAVREIMMGTPRLRVFQVDAP